MRKPAENRSNADSESIPTCRLYTHVRDLFFKIVWSFHAVIFAVGINSIDMLDGNKRTDQSLQVATHV